MSAANSRAAFGVPIFLPEVEQFGGAERSVLALARWLREQGQEAFLLCYADRCGLPKFADFPLHVEALQPEGGVRSKVAALRAWTKSRPAGAPAVLASGYQAAMHLVLAGERHFHCLMHDTPALFVPEHPALATRLRITMSNRILRHGFRHRDNHLIVTSEFLRDDCRKLFHTDADIVRMGGMQTAAQFRRRPVNGQLRMLSISRIENNKRIDWLLDALAALERRQPALSEHIDWRLDVAGRGSQLESMRARAAELGMESRVRFHGFVTDEQLEDLYGEAHLFLMPAVQGYGIPAIEALARGIPVLLHRDSGVSDILLDTPWASVATGGPGQMVEALESMIDRLLQPDALAVEPPQLPTEDTWAESVAKLCGYVAS